MEQMNVDEASKVTIDFSIPALPPSAGILQPLVYRQGQKYCCLLGPSPAIGIFGSGATAREAIIDWDVKLTARLASANEDDAVTTYVKDVYKAGNTEVW